MAEGARLESVFRVKPNEGSNPSLSAKYKEPALRRFFCVYRSALNDAWILLAKAKRNPLGSGFLFKRVYCDAGQLKQMAFRL